MKKGDWEVKINKDRDSDLVVRVQNYKTGYYNYCFLNSIRGEDNGVCAKNVEGIVKYMFTHWLIESNYSVERASHWTDQER